jgi:thioredoxin reductase
MYELAIYGLGPGGLIAAVNGASERLRQVLVGCFSI